jgi:hypothetical protein
VQFFLRDSSLLGFSGKLWDRTPNVNCSPGFSYRRKRKDFDRSRHVAWIHWSLDSLIRHSVYSDSSVSKTAYAASRISAEFFYPLFFSDRNKVRASVEQHRERFGALGEPTFAKDIIYSNLSRAIAMSDPTRSNPNQQGRIAALQLHSLTRAAVFTAQGIGKCCLLHLKASIAFIRWIWTQKHNSIPL